MTTTIRFTEMRAKDGIPFPPSPPRSEKADTESVHSSSSTSAEDEIDIPMPPPSETLTKILDIDANTPDFHVPRDPRLVRLTGVHPFNVEAPLRALFDEGT